MVNAASWCLICADFCVFFLVLGRFLHFKNPVKYSSIFEINQDSLGKAAQYARAFAKNRCNVNGISNLTYTQDICAKLLQNRTRPPALESGPPKQPGELICVASRLTTAGPERHLLAAAGLPERCRI
jgi:hypothetical protein